MNRDPIYVPPIFLVALPFEPFEDDPVLQGDGDVVELPAIVAGDRFGQGALHRLAGRVGALLRRRPVRGRSVSAGAAVLVTPDGVVRRLPTAAPVQRWAQLRVLAAVPPLPNRAIGWRGV